MYRILYSEQRKTFKIQFRLFFFWTDHTDHNENLREFNSIEEAKEELQSLRASDWKQVEVGKNGN